MTTTHRELGPEWCDFILNGTPKGERSKKILGCALSCYNAGWTFEEYACALLHPTNRGGEKLHRRRDARAYLERCWTKAQAFAAQSPADRPAASEALAHAARLRRRADTWPFPPRVGWTYRLVLEGHLLMVERTGKLVYYASLRDIAKLTGVGLGTVDRAQRWLRHEGWLGLIKGPVPRAREAAVWQSTIPARVTADLARRFTLVGLRHVPTPARCVTDTLSSESQPRMESVPLAQQPQRDPAVPPQSVPFAQHDLWLRGGLGLACGGVYRMLNHDEALSTRDVALNLDCGRTGAWRHLDKLRLHGLAVREPAGWKLGQADLDSVAVDLGVAGRLEAICKKIEREQEQFCDYLSAPEAWGFKRKAACR